jgi:hypothetical protein
MVVFVLVLLVGTPVAAFPQCTAYKRVALLVDVTASRDATITPMIRFAEVNQLVTALERCGDFELIVGLIARNSNREYARLDEPKRPVEPSEPPRGGNPFDYQIKHRAYLVARAAYEQELVKWQAEVTARKEKFRVEVNNLLILAHDNGTDVYTALQRVATFFANDRAFPDRRSQRLLIGVTDAQDNRRRTFTGFQDDVTVCIVNGIGSTGVLTPLKPFTFDSYAPLLDYVRKWGGV